MRHTATSLPAPPPFELERLVRPNIRRLTPYSSARDEFTGTGEVFVDANENPFGRHNRYPDPHQRALKGELARQRQLRAAQIFVGNGSDELIDLTFRIFCRPGVDRVLTTPPTYGMYRVSAAINDVEVVRVPLRADFQLDLPALMTRLDDPQLKIVFLCSPNNPTGNLLATPDIERILRRFPGIVFIDEAYADFTDQPSWTTRLDEFPNLLVSQTMSKSYGLAGARVGLGFASADIMELLRRVKPPYNVNALSQAVALERLRDRTGFERERTTLLAERAKLLEQLPKIAGVRRVFPTDTNFILFRVDEPDTVYRTLTERGVIVRNQHGKIPGALRISVGTPAENTLVLQHLEACLRG